MKIRLLDGSYSDMNIGIKAVAEHFNNANNYTKEILSEWESEPFKQFISPEDKVFLDIGGNVGFFAIHVLKNADNIICVEPTPAHMNVQKELINEQIARLNQYVEFHHEQSALNFYTGKVGFHIEPVNFTMNTLNYWNKANSIEVDCITLFDLCKKYNLEKVDFCKIDIEGSEFKALTPEEINPVYPIINKFLIELHPRTRESQDHFKKIFEETGYKVDYYDFNGSIYVYK